MADNQKADTQGGEDTSARQDDRAGRDGRGSFLKNLTEDANGRQLLAGGLASAFAYAALLTTGFGVISEPVQTVVANFQWQHLPLHLVFASAAMTAGAMGMAAWDRLRGRDITPPQP